MQQDTEVLDSYVQQIYAEKDPDKLLPLFKELAAHLKSINARDNMKLGVVHHLCMISDRLESRPDCLKAILSALVSAAQPAPEVPKFFATFLQPASPEEKKAPPQAIKVSSCFAMHVR